LFQVEKGEQVPPELAALLEAQQKPPIPVGPDGAATWGWGAGWGLFGFWGQLWVESGSDVVRPWLDRIGVLREIHLESTFTNEEVENLKALGVDIKKL